jgi:hypothetical protein
MAALVAAVEVRARAANTIEELSFSIANDAYGLMGFRQALVFDGAGKAVRLRAVSGLARPTEDSPYLLWLRRTWPWLHTRAAAAPGWLPMPSDEEGAPEGVMEGWREWWPAGVYALPLTRRSGEGLGWVLFLLDQPPADAQVRALGQLGQSWGYCWEMLVGKPRKSLGTRWLGRMQSRVLWVLALAALFIPVRQTALAPAEVIALEAETVAAPLEGVVKAIHVRPNQPVKAGEPLFSLDDTTLRNRLEVAQKSVAVADAELQAATQKAFDSFQSKGELALLSGRANEKRAELAAVRAQMARIDVTAPQDGVAVFGDPDDWLGRPVTTGERIMLLANPDKPGVLLHLPVADAIALEPGAPIKLFLTVLPLSPMKATVSETSYQSILSPEGVASYRLRAVFDGSPERARIGLRGTAKIHGERVLLGYYLLRRPLATLREWTGW